MQKLLISWFLLFYPFTISTLLNNVLTSAQSISCITNADVESKWRKTKSRCLYFFGTSFTKATQKVNWNDGGECRKTRIVVCGNKLHCDIRYYITVSKSWKDYIRVWAFKYIINVIYCNVTMDLKFHLAFTAFL